MDTGEDTTVDTRGCHCLQPWGSPRSRASMVYYRQALRWLLHGRTATTPGHPWSTATGRPPEGDATVKQPQAPLLRRGSPLATTPR